MKLSVLLSWPQCEDERYLQLSWAFSKFLKIVLLTLALLVSASKLSGDKIKLEMGSSPALPYPFHSVQAVKLSRSPCGGFFAQHNLGDEFQMLRCGVPQGLTHDTLYFWANKHIFPLVIGGLSRRPCVPARVRGHLFILGSGETLLGTVNIVDCGAVIGWSPSPNGLRGNSRTSLFSLASVFHCLRCEENLQSGFVEKACGVFLWGLAILDHARFHDSTCGEGGLSVMHSGSLCLGGVEGAVCKVSHWKKGDMLEGSCWPLFPLPPLQVGELCRSDKAERPGSFSLWTQDSSIFVCPWAGRKPGVLARVHTRTHSPPPPTTTSTYVNIALLIPRLIV